MVIIKGYKAKTTDIQAIESIMTRLQEEVALKGKRLYATLLAQEIETWVDDIALHVIPCPEKPIYDMAVQALDEKISVATGRGLPIPYNFGVQVAIFTYKGETYFKLNVNNDVLAQTIKVVPELTDFSLQEEELGGEENRRRGMIWSEIMEIYSNGNNPLVKSLYPCGPITPEWVTIASKFHSREQRAQYRIRHQLTSSMLNWIGMGKEIPPHRLMPYMDEALELLGTPTVKAEMQKMLPQLLQSIITITEEFAKTPVQL